MEHSDVYLLWDTVYYVILCKVSVSASFVVSCYLYASARPDRHYVLHLSVRLSIRLLQTCEHDILKPKDQFWCKMVQGHETIDIAGQEVKG